MGESRSTKDLERSCSPIITMKDLGMKTDLPLSKRDPANPCGLLPRSFFNDTYALYDKENKPIYINEQDINWDLDAEKF